MREPLIFPRAMTAWSGADGSVQLVPAYDIVPQAHLTNDGKLALAVNQKYLHSEITSDDLSDGSSGGAGRSES